MLKLGGNADDSDLCIFNGRTFVLLAQLYVLAISDSFKFHGQHYLQRLSLNRNHLSITTDSKRNSPFSPSFMKELLLDFQTEVEYP